MKINNFFIVFVCMLALTVVFVLAVQDSGRNARLASLRAQVKQQRTQAQQKTVAAKPRGEIVFEDITFKKELTLFDIVFDTTDTFIQEACRE